MITFLPIMAMAQSADASVNIAKIKQSINEAQMEVTSSNANSISAPKASKEENDFDVSKFSILQWITIVGIFLVSFYPIYLILKLAWIMTAPHMPYIIGFPFVLFFTVFLAAALGLSIAEKFVS